MWSPLHSSAEIGERPRFWNQKRNHGSSFGSTSRTLEGSFEVLHLGSGEQELDRAENIQHDIPANQINLAFEAHTTEWHSRLSWRIKDDGDRWGDAA